MSTDWITARGVKLARVGDWPTYRGNGTLTRDDLADMVAASKDPIVRGALEGDPPGWLGHVEDQVSASTRQSEPCVGRVTNLRLGDNGDSVYGDVEDVPVMVARMYPRRSVELQPNVTGTAGRVYGRVMTGLAYLGHKRGAITGLGDLRDLVDGRTAPVLAAAGDAVLMALADDEPTDHGTPQDVLPPAQGDRTVDQVMSDTDTQEPTVPAQDAPVEPEAPTASEPKPSEQPVPVIDPKDPPVGEPLVPDTAQAPEQPIVPDAGPETVEVTKSAFDEMKATLEDLIDFKKTTLAEKAGVVRDQAIAAALDDRRITKADVDSTQSFFAAHGTDAGIAMLQQFPKNSRGPQLGEIGHDAPDDDTAEFAEGNADRLIIDTFGMTRFQIENLKRAGYQVQED